MRCGNFGRNNERLPEFVLLFVYSFSRLKNAILFNFLHKSSCTVLKTPIIPPPYKNVNICYPCLFLEFPEKHINNTRASSHFDTIDNFCKYEY
jgi:hypothetical protein